MFFQGKCASNSGSERGTKEKATSVGFFFKKKKKKKEVLEQNHAPGLSNCGFRNIHKYLCQVAKLCLFMTILYAVNILILRITTIILQ